ncbi:hypothetical protein ONZ45_g8533 [Pleurotus djamor]|nr:hypothetical protein ONZ45_g8533 [Pleurotus djamor]
MVFFGKGWKRIFSATCVSQLSGTECEGGFDILRRFQRSENVEASDIDVEQYSQHEDRVDLSIVSYIAAYTGISHNDLESYEPSPTHLRTICTYMCRRSTTIPEDAAYCLISLLGIVLPTAYGEGKQHALHRLQVACAEKTNDRNIFLGDYSHGFSPLNSMLPLNPFRPHPYHLLGLSDNPKISVNRLWDSAGGTDQPDHTFTFTNGGLRISLTLHDIFYVHEPQDTLPAYTRKVYCTCSPNHPIQTTYHSMDPADTLEQFKLAILGTYTIPDEPFPHAYAMILERIDNSNIQTYRRTAITVFPKSLPPLHLLLLHPPTTVYIV